MTTNTNPLFTDAGGHVPREIGDALSTAFCLLDTLAGEGIRHTYGNGQTIKAYTVCLTLIRVLGLEGGSENNWYRVAPAALARLLSASPPPPIGQREREALRRIRAISSKPTYPGNNLRDIDRIVAEALDTPTGSAEPEIPADTLERLRIMSKQRKYSEMDEQDQCDADFEGAYDWFCDESRDIYAALSHPTTTAADKAGTQELLLARARVQAALRSIEDDVHLSELTDDELDSIILAALNQESR